MQDLVKQEQFEVEVLDALNSSKLLTSLVFVGGTMLRLCHGLNRFSVDLDFWIAEGNDSKELFTKINDCLSKAYIVKDSANKFYTLLFEIRTKTYPRSLKIEIRKDAKRLKTERAIAYSKYSNMQVYLKTAALKEMMGMKVNALLSREEIRDAFDLEFLLKKGIPIDISKDISRKILKSIDSFSKKDYQAKLGSLLEEKERKYYSTENFKILKAAIQERLRQ